MTIRERILAALRYQEFDSLPLLHFGFWGTRDSVLYRWRDEGRIPGEVAENWSDGNVHDAWVGEKLGFDFNWQAMFHPNNGLLPEFNSTVLEVLPDGGRKVLTSNGAVVLQKDGAGSIPMEFDYTLKSRTEWEEQFLYRLEFKPERIEHAVVHTPKGDFRFCEGGREYLLQKERELPCGIHCGSLYGVIRGWLGLEGICYLRFDDEELFDEIVQTVADLCFRSTVLILCRWTATASSMLSFRFGSRME